MVKVLGTAVFGGLGLIFTIGAMAGGNKNTRSSTPTTFNAPSPVTNTDRAPQANTAPTVEAVSESCLALATKFGTESKLSDLQKDELWKAYAGKSFEWELKITEVSAGMLGGFSVQAKCSPSSPSLIQDVHLSYDGDAKSFVMGLQKDGKYKLKGVLKSQTTLLGLQADGIP